ncbi:MAG: hypothetical protein M1831_003625 [Alyxoria varia]|nr:MAG: hypothetical protein M1831_003625 [Alyxoria varia]
MGSKSTRLAQANALDADAFRERYVEPACSKITFLDTLEFSFATASSITESELNGCFNLVKETSAAAYKASSKGWSDADKRKEMKELDMKYLMLRTVSSGYPEPMGVHKAAEPQNIASKSDDQIAAFLSFMLTPEDDVEVVYCYEIHLKPDLQGIGLGTHLMKVMENIGALIEMSIAMLTVFASNEGAINFYKRCGYEWYDEEPTPPRKRLRSGVKDKPRPTYIIMAKDLTQKSSVC